VYFFHRSTPALIILVFGVTLGATAVGWFIGRRLRQHSDHYRDSFSALQGALLGFMALLLAFSLSLGVGRYESRRAAGVAEVNALGTTYLRAQTLEEPVRSQSLELLKQFADTSIRITKTIPGSGAQRAVTAQTAEIERELWSLAGQALDEAPVASAPRLYVESLNETFDARTTRLGGLGNRVPTPVLLLQFAAAAIALAVLAMHLAVLGRGVLPGALAAVLASLCLLVTFDLDRPTRGFIRIPSSSLENLRASMDEPPAARG
jgi:hypothetical protein